MKMDTVLKLIKAFLTLGGTFLGFCFEAWDMPLKALVAVIIIDYISGLVCGYSAGELSSAVGAKGIAKKFMYIVIVALANIIDGMFGETGLLRNAAIYLFIANEGLSIVENAGKLGLPIPELLREKLEQLRNKDGDKG